MVIALFKLLRLSVAALLSALVGCAMHNAAFSPPQTPPAYEQALVGAGTPISPNWWRGFESARLNELVALAARNNWDLVAAQARVRQADARARQAGAAILPSLEGTGNANFLAGHSSHGGGHELDWSAMLSASYELDFWGKNRAIARSAQALAGAASAERDTVALTTLAAVAAGYFQVQALRERLEIAHLNCDAAQQLTTVVQSRFDAGVADPVELATQKASYDTARIAISDLEQTEVEARASLSLLLGREPEQFTLPAESLDAIQEPSVAAGMPAALLTRRPDIAAAESNLQSARADVMAARAAMLPSITLTAGAGLQNPALPATVLTIPGVGPSFALGAGLIQPIFNHGRLRAQRDEVQAKDEELLSAYRASIIAALTDVENALAAIHHLEQSRDYQIERVAQSERAFEGARLRYQAGSGDFLTLLEAQRTVYAARDQFVQYKLARLQSRVGLFKALGGGWEREAPTPAVAFATRNLN